MRSAILFMIFNRPEQTALSFAQIRAARPPRLYVAADGPRDGREGEDRLCKAARQIAAAVDWPCEVKTLFRKRNLGCRLACSSALSWFFEQEAEGIVLEDDIEAHPDFFTFCDDLLERYREVPKVSMISGFNYQMGRIRGDASYYFSHHSHIWGWASWARTWKGYDPTMAGYAHFLMNELPKRLGVNRLSLHYKSFFDSDMRDKTWDFALMYQNLRQGRLSVIPNYPLVNNIGFTTGIHFTISTIWDLQRASGLPGELRHPAASEACLDAARFDVDLRHQGMRGLCLEAFRRAEAGETAACLELLRMARAHHGADAAFDEIEAVARMRERLRADNA
ncbi:MAG: hypothetical protein LBV01_04735 [Deltaproteobacteria bacterium]|jgi:hypothetical protein|nr:hypothetical protein [Deltaproteobacteria bacterium]